MALGALAMLAGGCALDPPVTAALASPEPPLALCDQAGCVALPAATAMPAGRAAFAPRGWLEYCSRLEDGGDPACAGSRR